MNLKKILTTGLMVLSIGCSSEIREPKKTDFLEKQVELNGLTFWDFDTNGVTEVISYDNGF